MKLKLLYFLLALFLLADLGYSFVQHLNMTLEGDMAGGIVPEDGVKQVLADPFGFSVLFNDAVYPNPNRFFAHWTFYHYFNFVPISLQAFLDPIESVYWTCALGKIAIQMLLIALLAFYITGSTKVFNRNFILASVLVVPLFQANGFRSNMGIIDPSTTYTFFYALPCALLLLFYLPFFRNSYNGIRFPKGILPYLLLMGMAVLVTLNGPLNTGIILTISLVFTLKIWSDTFQPAQRMTIMERVRSFFQSVPKPHLVFFLAASVLSLYSLYIGMNNSIFVGENLPISERYMRIPMGIFLMTTQKLAFPLLFAAIGLNLFLVGRYLKGPEAHKMLTFFKWFGLFALVYILLLPLGGYKSYRPYTVRYDTVMPITLGLIFMYGISTYSLIKYSVGNWKKYYLLFVLAFSLAFTLADKPELGKNACEKSALREISTSTENPVLIGSACNVLSWERITDPQNSELNAQFMTIMGITKEKKLYYQK